MKASTFLIKVFVILGITIPIGWVLGYYGAVFNAPLAVIFFISGIIGCAIGVKVSMSSIGE